MADVDRNINALQEELEKTRRTLEFVDDNLKKLTGKDPTWLFNNRGSRGGGRGRNISRTVDYSKRPGDPIGDEVAGKRRIVGSAFSRLGLPVAQQQHRSPSPADENITQPNIRSAVTAVEPARSRQEALQEQSQDTEGKTRNKRMFGLLLGTLQRFKVEERQQQTVEEKRKQVERRLERRAREAEEDLKKERDDLMRTRRQQQYRIGQIQREMEMVKQFTVWRQETLKLKSFIMTHAQPCIYFMPRQLTAANDQQLVDSRRRVDDIILERKQELDRQVAALTKHQMFAAGDNHNEPLSDGHVSDEEEDNNVEQEGASAPRTSTAHKMSVKAGQNEQSTYARDLVGGSHGKKQHATMERDDGQNEEDADDEAQSRTLVSVSGRARAGDSNGVEASSGVTRGTRGGRIVAAMDSQQVRIVVRSSVAAAPSSQVHWPTRNKDGDKRLETVGGKAVDRDEDGERGRERQVINEREQTRRGDKQFERQDKTDRTRIASMEIAEHDDSNRKREQQRDGGSIEVEQKPQRLDSTNSEHDQRSATRRSRLSSSISHPPLAVTIDSNSRTRQVGTEASTNVNHISPVSSSKDRMAACSTLAATGMTRTDSRLESRSIAVKATTVEKCSATQATRLEDVTKRVSRPNAAGSERLAVKSLSDEAAVKAKGSSKAKVAKKVGPKKPGSIAGSSKSSSTDSSSQSDDSSSSSASESESESGSESNSDTGAKAKVKAQVSKKGKGELKKDEITNSSSSSSSDSSSDSSSSGSDSESDSGSESDSASASASAATDDSGTENAVHTDETTKVHNSRSRRSAAKPPSAANTKAPDAAQLTISRQGAAGKHR